MGPVGVHAHRSRICGCELVERYKRQFWGNVDVGGIAECWGWRGSVDPGGHGVYLGQRSHRIALYLSGVLIRPRTDVHHICGQKLCCNPMHLQVMRHSDHSRVTRGIKSGIL